MPKWNLTVEPTELQFAVQLGNAAVTDQMQTDNPETKGIDLFDEKSGEFQEFQCKDNPINRFGCAIATEFGKNVSKYYSIMNRIGILMRLMSDERVNPYLKTDSTDSERTMINNVLIEVLAKFPVSDAGELDRDAFFREVQELIENKKD
ncbi:MAG: hypothetical protein ABIK92_17550 [Pseudomonadota bacterium]